MERSFLVLPLPPDLFLLHFPFLFIPEPTAAPTNVNVVIQGKSSVRVTWKSPDEESVRGYIRGFKVSENQVLYASVYVL